MAKKKRGPDGMPVEIPSHKARRLRSLFGRAAPDLDSGAARLHEGKDAHGEDAIPTEPSEPPPAGPKHAGARESRPSPPADPPTIIAGRWRRKLGKPNAESSIEPVVGWLVVVDGPGKGSSLQLGFGRNTIGRGESSRVRLDFGDHQISRDSHAVLSYDPQGNRYSIHQDRGSNLTYVDEVPVLAPTPLPTGSRIVLGGTTLRFIAFCDEDFTW